MGNYECWQPAKEVISATINFAVATGKLEDGSSQAERER